MKTLWLYPPPAPEAGADAEYRIRRNEKRACALADTLPPGVANLYAAEEVTERARLFADAAGLLVRPLSERGGDFRVICDTPQAMESSIGALTGARVFFDRPGAALTEQDENGERLLWKLDASDWIFLQYPDEPVIPPRRDSGHSLRALLLPAIENQASVMRKNLRSFLERPEEPEGVHQLRVSIRSFRALISLTKPLLPEDEYAALQDLFRQLGRKCARLREFDVLMEEWESVKKKRDVKLRRALEAERKVEMHTLVDTMQDPYTRRTFSAGAERFVQALENTPWRTIDGLEFIDRRLHAWYRFSLEGLWKMDGFDWPVAHRIRLKSKKYRYIAEHFKPHMTDIQIARHKAAKKRQTVLGHICDSLRNQEAVEELLPAFNPGTAQEAARFMQREKTREETLRATVGRNQEEPMPETPKKTPPRKTNIFATRWPLLILIITGFLLVYFMTR